MVKCDIFLVACTFHSQLWIGSSSSLGEFILNYKHMHVGDKGEKEKTFLLTKNNNTGRKCIIGLSACVYCYPSMHADAIFLLFIVIFLGIKYFFFTLEVKFF